jgi:hypothetical protein
MTLTTEETTAPRSSLWFAIVGAAFILSYLLGYVVSSKTGVEPGFFERAEAGGYGVTTEKSEAAGLDKDLQDYYKTLTDE